MKFDLKNLTETQKTRLYLFLAACGCGLLIMMAGLFYLIKDLPDTRSLIEYRPKTITHVYAKEGEKIGEFYRERRTVIALDQVPKHVLQSFLSAEDSKFFEHSGIDYIGIIRAALINMLTNRLQGASTITQQVAKTFFLSSERKYSRKIKEAVLAKRIEDTLSKQEILHLYLNQIYFGSGAYGLQSAAERYFGKDVEELTLAEGALIAGLPKAPSRFSPYKNYPRAKIRQEWIITRMLELGHINRETAEEALNQKLELITKKARTLWSGKYFTEHIRRYIEEKYGEEILYQGGLHIYTTMDVNMQKAANKAVDKNLRRHDKRRGYRGPIENLTNPDEDITKETIEDYLTKIDKELKVTPLKAGAIYYGVIVEVDSQNKNLVVHIGHNEGVITASHMRWAKRYIPADSTEEDIKKVERDQKLVEPITVFNVGDVINVKIRVLPEVEDETPILLRLEQEPLAEAALLSMDSSTGEVRAMVGGSSFSKTQFNRTIQSIRQPGSSFKPIVYATALDNGFTNASIIIDAPTVFECPAEELENRNTIKKALENGEELYDVEGNLITELEDKICFWAPENDDGKYLGPLTLRTGISKSRNIISVKLANTIGTNKIIKTARKLGIKGKLNKDLSLALGGTGVTLLEMTTAYATISNLGVRTKPIFITKIVDRYGNILEEFKPEFTQAMSPQTAYLTTSLLEGVVQNGTGWRAKALGRPVGGKTGTTNDLNDAWFIGFIPGLTTATWMGYDEEKTLGFREYGGRAAGPIWVGYMKEVTKDMPIRNFPIPEGIEFVKIDSKTGLLPDEKTYKKIEENEKLEEKKRKKIIIFEAFKKGTAPKRTNENIGDDHHPDEQELYMMEGGFDEDSDIPSGLDADIANDNQQMLEEL